MSNKSKIEWTDATWNPVTGCTKVSAGCKYCYAERDWNRVSSNPRTSYYGRKFTEVYCDPNRLETPIHWRKPRMIFVNSMSDLFHEAVPDEFIESVFATIALAPQHVFQILTKRPERMLKWFTGTFVNDSRADAVFAEFCARGGLDLREASELWKGWPPPNAWIGVSVESQETADRRIPLLLETPAAVRWISAEPLLEEITLSGLCLFHGALVDWVVIGGESGPSARPFHLSWADALIKECRVAGVPVFLKQMGASPVLNGRPRPLLYGRKGNRINDWPESYRIREYPEIEIEI